MKNQQPWDISRIKEWFGRIKAKVRPVLSKVIKIPIYLMLGFLKLLTWIWKAARKSGPFLDRAWSGKLKPWLAGLKMQTWPSKVKDGLVGLKIHEWPGNIKQWWAESKIRQWARMIRIWFIKLGYWWAKSGLRQDLQMSKIKEWPVIAKIRQWFDVADDDGFLLRALMVLALLLLFIMFAFGPCYDYGTEPAPTPELTPMAMKYPAYQAPAQPEPKPTAKTLYIRAVPTPTVTMTPMPTPTVTMTPMPTPTPTGGGFHKIAFASNRANGRFYQLHMMDSDGKNVERLTTSNAFDRDPHFSYDGNTIAFSSNREAGIYQIYLLDIKTRAIRQITSGPKDKTNPIWSPNNRQILFTIHREGSSELGMMDSSGANLKLLTNTYGNNHGYSFSPDGKMVAYESSVNDRNEVFLLELETRKSSVLIKTGELGYRGDPVYSPAGGKLIFTSDIGEHKVRQISVYDFGLDYHNRVTQDPDDKDDPAVSPDGTEVAFIAQWENAWNIFIMNIDGTNRRNLTKSYYDNLVPTWR